MNMRIKTNRERRARKQRNRYRDDPLALRKDSIQLVREIVNAQKLLEEESKKLKEDENNQEDN
jgi:hypothetical protein